MKFTVKTSATRNAVGFMTPEGHAVIFDTQDTALGTLIYECGCTTVNVEDHDIDHYICEGDEITINF